MVTETGSTVSTYGEVFTKPWVVEAILDLVGYTADADLPERVIVEPSCGAGAFLVPITERLVAAAARLQISFTRLGRCVRAYDLQQDNVDLARKQVVEVLLSAGCPRDSADRLAQTWVHCADYLLDDERIDADFVVGNPPYIRLEALPKALVAQYRQLWPTMRGRADIYVGFIEKMLRILAPGARLGVICADRWMRNQYGEHLRKRIAREYAVEHVWSLHHVDAFETDVAAYPAITVLSRRPQATVAVADTRHSFGAEQARRLVAWAHSAGKELDGKGFTAFRAESWPTDGGAWPTGSVARLRLLTHLEATFPPLEQSAAGTNVSIGVATGADAVYITTDPTLVEPDRHLPLVMTEDLETGQFSWTGKQLVNPWDDDGLVDLSQFPRLRRYFNRHAETLRNRHVAKNRSSGWHKTIDRVRPGLVGRKKICIPDMKATMHPVLVPEGFYPHHNVYYVISDEWDLEVLGGLLLSRVAQAFVEAYCVRMRGDTLRFQAQYLRKIRVPRPETLPAGLKRKLKTAFRNRNVEAATKAALVAYGLDSLPD